MKYVSFCLNKKEGNPKQPYRKYSGDAGWDLFVSREVEIPAGQTVDVHTDISIQIPPCTFARITGRSSTIRKHNLLVSEGIIDNGYTGELFVCVTNLGKETFVAKEGMRLAQVIFHKIEDVRWAEVEELKQKDNDRNTNGFGSTGE